LLKKDLCLNLKSRTSYRLAIGALILALGLAWAWVSGRDAQAGLVAGHEAAATAAAAAFTAEELRSLSGSKADLGTDQYRRVKERLGRLAGVDPSVRLVYLLRNDRQTGKTIFLADSLPDTAPGPLAPGDEYPHAQESAALARTLITGLPAAEGPIADPAETLMVAYAPVSLGRTATLEGIIGVESATAQWTAVFWQAAFPHALYLWVLLGLPYGALILSQRDHEQREALRNLSEAMQQSQSAVMIVNLDSRIEFVNAGLVSQIGYSRRELIGRPWRDFQQKETPPELLADMVASVRAGRPWQGQWYNRRKNGELYPVRGAISPVKNRAGRLTSFVAVFEDMTEVNRAQSTMRVALDRAEAGDLAKSRFLATMSHEVRTPLNGIVGFTSLLLDMPLTAEQRDCVQMIRTSGESLIQLTSDILDFAKIESRSVKLELRPGNPRVIVEDTLDLMAVQAGEKQIELLHWVDDNVPANVMLDDARLRQVLSNLVWNAVKFTDAGTVEITLEAELPTGGLPPGGNLAGRLIFNIRDTGIGIAPEHHGLLFKPFSQVDESSTRRYGGTGLGLAICRNLVELMGGTISMQSAPGQGSSFTFCLPFTTVPGMARTAPTLGRVTLALVAKPGPFRDEFSRLAQRWRAPLTLLDEPIALATADCDLGFVELYPGLARQLAAVPPGAVPWVAGQTYGIVPVGLENEVRASLRAHFGQLINKPMHHDALLALLAGIPAGPPSLARVRAFGLNVLVVEDNVVNQRLVQRLLANMGCRATVAGNGRLAIAELARLGSHYDLVLMDLHMPELDGLSAIERIRSGEAGDAVRQIWIAVLTADARTEQKELVLAAGANDYLVKPVGVADLASGLQRFCESRPA
jgi:PAS domain S-box-containing protein